MKNDDEGIAADRVERARSRAGMRMRAVSVAALLGGVVGVGSVVGVVGGCQPSVGAQGRGRDIMATYSVRTLSVQLEAALQVLTVQAAAESAVRSRGYIVTSATGTADTMRVEAKDSGSGDWDRLVVEGCVKQNSTEISVRCEPWGDEGVSRAVMDAVLIRLGR